MKQQPDSQPLEYQKPFHLTLKIAEQGFATIIPAQEKKDLSTLFRCMYWVDKHLDEAPASARPAVETDVMNFLSRGMSFSHPADQPVLDNLDRLAVVLDSRPPTVKETFCRHVRNIFDCFQTMTTTTSTAHFSAARKREAYAVADMVCLVGATLGKNRPFHRFYRELVLLSSVIDSIEDAQKDWVAGLVAINPVKMRFAMTKEACTHTIRCGAVCPKKGPFFLNFSSFLLRRYLLGKSLPAHWVSQPSPNP